VSDDDTIPPGGTGFDDGDEARPDVGDDDRPRDTETYDDEGPEGSDPETDDIVEHRSRQRRVVLLTSIVAVVALAVGIAIWRSGGEETAKAAPSTTTTTTTTTTIPPVRHEITIATAKVPSLSILRDPPAGWDTTAASVRWDQPEPPSSIGSLPERPALPRPDYPLAGRYSSDTGWAFSNPTSFGGPLTLMVTEQRGDWLKVEVPVRPNGTDGYVKASDVDLATTTQHIELHVGERKLKVYDGDTLTAESSVVVGKDETRTPLGRFFVTDQVVQKNPAGFYGPLILALSAYSEQLDIFDDGVPVIAMHGTSRPDLIGQAVSNGCIRVPNEVITQIGATVPVGTPVDILA